MSIINRKLFPPVVDFNCCSFFQPKFQEPVGSFFISKTMNLDTFSIAALADELRIEFMGGRVQQIIQITPMSFGLEFYAQHKRRYLLLSAEPQSPRVHLQAQKPRRGDAPPSPMFQLLRKYLRGSLLMTIEQPPYERLLQFHFSGKLGETSLVAEMMGSRSNLIFLDADDKILTLLRPAPTKSEFSRALLPKHRYTLPRAQQKIDPNAKNAFETLHNALSQSPPDALLGKTLVKHLMGLSPLIAREIVFRAYQNTDVTLAEVQDFIPLKESIKLMYKHISDHAWHPHVVYTQARAVSLFTPIALTHNPRAEAIDSISMAIEAHFQQNRNASDDGYFAARLPIQQRLKKHQARLERRQQNLAKDAESIKDPEIFKEKGNAILANSWQIEARQTTLSAMWTDGETLEIELDPQKSPAENAQRYFARYQKAKRAAEIIPQRKKSLALELEYLAQLGLDLELATTRPEIDAVAVELDEIAPKSTQKSTKKQNRPHPTKTKYFESPDGFRVWAGKNAKQNHHITFSKANPNDIWLHARGVPGAHVIIDTRIGEPPESTILWAAGIAAYFSKLRGENLVDVIVTRKKYVRAIKGAPPGLVSVRQEKTVRVAPLNPDEL